MYILCRTLTLYIYQTLKLSYRFQVVSDEDSAVVLESWQVEQASCAQDADDTVVVDVFTDDVATITLEALQQVHVAHTQHIEHIGFIQLKDEVNQFD